MQASSQTYKAPQSKSPVNTPIENKPLKTINNHQNTNQNTEIKTA